MIKIKKNINIAFLVCALLQITTITASSSVNQTNYNNAFLAFYQTINGKAASSISEAAQYIQSHKDSQALTPMTTTAKSLNTKEAQRVGAFLADVNPALEPSKFPGLDSEANINTAFAAAQGLISPITLNGNFNFTNNDTSDITNFNFYNSSNQTLGSASTLKAGTAIAIPQNAIYASGTLGSYTLNIVLPNPLSSLSLRDSGKIYNTTSSALNINLNNSSLNKSINSPSINLAAGASANIFYGANQITVLNSSNAAIISNATISSSGNYYIKNNNGAYSISTSADLSNGGTNQSPNVATATDTAAADLLRNIQSSIGTYNQYLTSLNKGIPALTIPSSPAGVPAA